MTRRTTSKTIPDSWWRFTATAAMTMVGTLIGVLATLWVVADYPSRSEVSEVRTLAEAYTADKRAIDLSMEHLAKAIEENSEAIREQGRVFAEVSRQQTVMTTQLDALLSHLDFKATQAR